MLRKMIQSILIIIFLFTSAYNFINIPGSHQNENFYYIDYANGNIPISELPIGSRVVDLSWEWEYKFGENYSQEILHSEHTDSLKFKPVTWIIVAHDFYECSEQHVTLLSEDLIAYYAFDDSTNRGSEYGSNHWGDSGNFNAAHGLRPWLNSEDIHSNEGLYQAFSSDFKHAIVNVDLPNCEWDDNTQYITNDHVFIPSASKIGNKSSVCGQTYPYFKGILRPRASNRIAKLDNIAMWYWTRTPAPSNHYMIVGVNPDGGFMDYVASHGDHAVRPVVNLSAEVLVSESKPLPTPVNDTTQTPGVELIADQSHVTRAAEGENLTIPGIDYENLIVNDRELKMAAGPYYSLFIDDNGDLYYLGEDPLIDMFGIEFLSSGEPSPMKITGLSEVRSVTAGIDSFFIILENGDLYFMEADRCTGKLITNNESPIPIPEKVNGVSKVKAVAAGYWHTLILLENGDLYTYGFNDMGQLGLGTLTDYHSPEKVEGLNEVAAISAGAHHSLALLGNGDLYAFGYNNSGQLGLGDREDRFTPVLVDTLSGAVAISAGDYHSLVLLANGDVYSFGEGSSGQLGHGDNKKYLLPSRVEDLSGITAISAGDLYSLSLSEQGIIYLFGYTYQNGQSIASPVIIAGLDNVTTVTAGFYHFLTTTKSGDLYQLGLITPDKLSTSPELIEFINKGKIANLPVLEDNLNNNPPTISGYWQGIVDYHEYNHAQILLHFSEVGIFTVAFPQSGYLCLFNYFYAEEQLYIYNPFSASGRGLSC